ncbi:MAG: DNA-deoxyinosine glycosylase [Eubacteriales bacterium]|nr:DNA-deoxyinosine glycosylase [Eubacteriales bacterium]
MQDEEGLQYVTHEFPPLYDQDSEILILGSIPSPKSREQGFYYGHPQNRFWKVMAAVLGELMPEDIAQKKEMLLHHHIALWDVLAECRIRGAADGSIRDAVPNDIASLLIKTKIRRIYTTGATAQKLYEKLVYPTAGIAAVRLPSTSPANCAVGFERLCEAYRQITENS